LAGAEADRPGPLPEAMAVVEDRAAVAPTHVLIRGEVDQKGDPVEPGPPRAPAGRLTTFADLPPAAPTTGRRAALAGWMAGEAAPLVARVLVNRLWQGHFGRGIVETPSDFGATGVPPTHPELLDWLAAELIAGGWGLKAI